MGKTALSMGQRTETSTDRPSEVSVIRFVSRNRTIEEIVPKKVKFENNQLGSMTSKAKQSGVRCHTYVSNSVRINVKRIKVYTYKIYI